MTLTKEMLLCGAEALERVLLTGRRRKEEFEYLDILDGEPTAVAELLHVCAEDAP